MGQTIKRYPTVEVAIKTQSCAPLASGHERVIEGDIVAVRVAGDVQGVGLNERHRHLWVRIDGWEEEELDALGRGVEGYEKRRYRLPLARLKEVVASLDLDRARDPTDAYQPFLPIDEHTGLYLTAARPLPVDGLVFDTVTGRYR